MVAFPCFFAVFKISWPRVYPLQMAREASVTVRTFSRCCQWVEFGVGGDHRGRRQSRVYVQDDNVHQPLPAFSLISGLSWDEAAQWSLLLGSSSSIGKGVASHVTALYSTARWLAAEGSAGLSLETFYPGLQSVIFFVTVGGERNLG